MKLFSAILLVLLLTFTISAQQDDALVRPFFYVTRDVEPNGYNNWDLFIMDANTLETVYAIESAEADCPVHFSPNQEMLLYSTGQYYELNVRRSNIINLTSSETTELDDYIWSQAWSPDNQYLAYNDGLAEPNVDPTLYVHDIQSGTRQLIMDTSRIESGAFEALLWLGDDLYFAVSSYASLAVYRWHDNQTQELMAWREFESPNLSYSLSPNAQYGIVKVDADPVDHIYVQDFSAQQTYSLDVASDYLPTWHPDGNMFVFFMDDGRLSSFNLREREYNVSFIATYVQFLHLILWSPNGESFLFREFSPNVAADKATYTLSRYNLETQETSNVDEIGTHWINDIMWISDTEILYTKHPEPDAMWDLYFYDTETGLNTRLTDTPDIEEYIGCVPG